MRSMNIDRSIELIREFARANKMRKATLAKAAGLAPNTLRKMDEANWSPRPETLRILEAHIAAQSSEAA